MNGNHTVKTPYTTSDNFICYKELEQFTRAPKHCAAWLFYLKIHIAKWFLLSKNTTLSNYIFPPLAFYKYFKVWLENCGQILQGFLVSIPSSGPYHIYVNIFWRTHLFNCCGKALGGPLLTGSDHCCFSHLQITSRWVSVTQRWRIFITYINSARIPQTYGKCTMLQHAQTGEQGHKQHTTQGADAACRLAGMPLFLLAVLRYHHDTKNSDCICKYNTLWGTQCPEYRHLASHKAVFLHLASKCRCRRPSVTMRVGSTNLVETSQITYRAWKQHQMQKFKAPKSAPQWCGIFKSSSQPSQIW